MLFNEKQMEKLYYIAINSRMIAASTEEMILELRAGSFDNIVEALGIILSIITILNNIENLS